MLLMAVPLIMYYQRIAYDKVITNPYYVTAESYADLFSFYKTIAIYIVAILCVVFYFLYTKKRDIILKKERIKYYIPLAVYSLFIIISTILSIYPKVAIFGIYERYEGALALLSYIIIMIYAIEIVRNDTDMKYIFSAFLGMVFIVSLIGSLQYFVVDIFSFRFMQWIVGIPEESMINAHFDNWAYGTLYNPNNVGQFAALTAPITAGLILAFKTIKGKIFAGIVLALSILVGISCRSANFIAGIAAAALMFSILYAAHFIPRNKKLKIALFVMIGIVFLGVFAFSGKIWNKISQTRFINAELESFKPEEDDIYFENIIVSDDTVKFITSQGEFNLIYTERGMSFCDSEKNFIDYSQKGNSIKFTNEPYASQWAIKITSDYTLDVIAKRASGYAQIAIVFNEERFLGIRGTGGKILHDIMENQMPEKWRGLETMASRRGYLWIVTMSRLDDVFFYGAGPDNFLYWFEQNDVVGKVNFLHTTSILADKPHNWYLQIASQTGVISLMAFLVMMGTYIVTTLKVLGLRRKKMYYEFISSGILCGVLGFMTASIFVDSNVGVTPIFFAVLGIGIVSNEHLKQIRIKDRNLKNSSKLRSRSK